VVPSASKWRRRTGYRRGGHGRAGTRVFGCGTSISGNGTRVSPVRPPSDSEYPQPSERPGGAGLRLPPPDSTIESFLKTLAPRASVGTRRLQRGPRGSQGGRLSGVRKSLQPAPPNTPVGLRNGKARRVPVKIEECPKGVMAGGPPKRATTQPRATPVDLWRERQRPRSAQLLCREWVDDGIRTRGLQGPNLAVSPFQGFSGRVRLFQQSPTKY
jgi:hypothetical protein